MIKRPILLPSLFGITGGLISSFAYPNNSVWFAIFPAIALILHGIRATNRIGSLVVGFVAGFAFYASQIPWMTVYLGPVPWLALSFLEACIFAIGAWAINCTFDVAKSRFSALTTSLLVASLWTAREWLACNFPYGGFPWSRVALSQANSPLANWGFWGGVSAITFVIVMATTLIMLEIRGGLRPQNWASQPAALVLVGVFVIPQVAPISTTAKDSISIAAVQGNANAGLFANSEPGSILKNHLDASTPLLSQRGKFDVVVWPENAADQNPLANPSAKWKIANFTSEINAPLIFGTITSRGDDIFNSSVLWQPNVGAVDWYDKKRPVAFGEFVPDRDFFHMLAPQLIDLIPRGYSFGTKDGIYEISTAKAGETKLGTMICFEIAVDDISHDLVDQGAELLIVQTNNSDFGTTNESAQQLAIARLRAIETGRVVVNISTVGLSALIAPDGKLLQELPAYQPGILSGTLPLLTDITPAMQVGRSLEITNNFAAIAQIIAVYLLGRRKRAANGK